MEHLIEIIHLIGSATPLIILCYMVVFILKGKKLKRSTVISYLIVAVILFIVLLRT